MATSRLPGRPTSLATTFLPPLSPHTWRSPSGPCLLNCQLGSPVIWLVVVSRPVWTASFSGEVAPHSVHAPGRPCPRPPKTPRFLSCCTFSHRANPLPLTHAVPVSRPRYSHYLLLCSANLFPGMSDLQVSQLSGFIIASLPSHSKLFCRWRNEPQVEHRLQVRCETILTSFQGHE